MEERSTLPVGRARAIPKLAVILSCASLLLMSAPSAARASAFNKLELLTFSNPVSLPGVTLPAGTYRFELADPSTSSSAVRVMSKNGAECYGTFLTLPDYEAQPPQMPVSLEKRPGTTEAIDAWYYPGDDVGREFIYPTMDRSMR